MKSDASQTRGEAQAELHAGPSKEASGPGEAHGGEVRPGWAAPGGAHAEVSVNDMLGRLLCILARQVGAHCVSLWLEDEIAPLPHGCLFCQAGQIKSPGDSDAALDRCMKGRMTDPMWAEIVRTGRPVLFETDRQSAWAHHYRDRCQTQGVRWILAVPFMLAGRVCGSIRICSRLRFSHGGEHIELAQAIAHQAGLALQLALQTEQDRQAAVLEERTRLARDIHDTLTHHLTGVVLHLETAQAALQDGRTAEAGEYMRRASEQARTGLSEARHSVQTLRRPALDHGDLCTTLQALLQGATCGTKLQGSFQIDGVPRALPADWGEHLLHIAQEALTNTLKHARAGRFETRLAFAPHDLRLELRDDGHGFNPLTRRGGFGLTGIQERVSRMSGRLIVESAVGQGTSITVVLPLPNGA